MQDLVDFGDEDGLRIAQSLGAYVEPPDPEVKSSHIAAIAAESATLRHAADATRRSADLTRHPTRRFRVAPRRLAILPAALLLVFLGTAGLAVAGVSLPGAARAPFDAVGVNLPNQSRASDVHAVIDSTQPGERGCEFGQAVAAAASQGRSNAPESVCDHSSQGSDHSQGADHSQAGDHGRGAAHGQASASDQADQGGQPSGVPPAPPAGKEFGQSTAQDAQQNASTDHQAFGQRTSQGAQELTPSTPPTGAGEQGASGESHSTQGLSTAGNTPAGSGPGGSHGP